MSLNRLHLKLCAYNIPRLFQIRNFVTNQNLLQIWALKHKFYSDNLSKKLLTGASEHNPCYLALAMFTLLGFPVR